jgi:hypothetical protein
MIFYRGKYWRKLPLLNIRCMYSIMYNLGTYSF